MRLFSGISISPLPYGQMPARVRKSVLLPQPEAPVIKRRSPSLMVRLQSESSTRPSGSLTSKSRTTSASSAAFSRTTSLLMSDAPSIWAVKPERR